MGGKGIVCKGIVWEGRREIVLGEEIVLYRYYVSSILLLYYINSNLLDPFPLTSLLTDL